MKHLFRVPSMLTLTKHRGCFYYFAKHENAVKAMLEFETGITMVPYSKDTRTCDDWYE